MAEFTASERQLEDWVCANIRIVTGDPMAEVVGRQLPLANGMVLDVLALTREDDSVDLVVIELKRQVIDEAAIAQALTYIGALNHDYVLNSEVLTDDAGVFRHYQSVRGLVIAPAITSAACHILLGLNGLVQYKLLSFGEFGATWDAFNLGRPMPRDSTNKLAWQHIDRVISGPLDRVQAAATNAPSTWRERALAAEEPVNIDARREAVRERR
jgi:hypothetical protein